MCTFRVNINIHIMRIYKHSYYFLAIWGLIKSPQQTLWLCPFTSVTILCDVCQTLSLAANILTLTTSDRTYTRTLLNSLLIATGAGMPVSLVCLSALLSPQTEVWLINTPYMPQTPRWYTHLESWCVCRAPQKSSGEAHPKSSIKLHHTKPKAASHPVLFSGIHFI